MMNNTPPTGPGQDDPAAHPARRHSDAALRAIEARLGAGTQRMDALEAAMRANTAMTAGNEALLKEVLDIMTTAKAGFRALGWLGAVVRWVGGLAAAGAALWALYQSIRNGTPPPQ